MGQQLKGFFNKKRDIEQGNEDTHITSSPIGESKVGLDVSAQIAVAEISTLNTITAASNANSLLSGFNIITIAGLSGKVGDTIRFTSGAIDGKEVKITGVSGDDYTISETLSADPTGEDFTLSRPTSLKVAADGGLSVSGSGPIKFRRDGAEQEVIEDTVTPANNRPLPVKLTDVTGDINITANDLNVALDHANDSVKIGDGTEFLSINASNEAEVSDASTHTKLDSLLTELQAKADLTETQPVSASSLPLPSGAATEATLSSIDADITTIVGDTTSIDGKTPALGAALTAASTPVNIASDQTVPVSAASLPLPSGAATETTLAALAAEDFATQTTLAAVLTELQAKADLTETQPVSAASLPLPSGAATETTLAALAAEDFATQTTLAAQAADIALLEDRLAGSLVPDSYDDIQISYVASGNGQGEIETVEYRSGGGSGTLVKTITITYDSSNRITQVTAT